MMNYYYPYSMHYGFGFGGIVAFLWLALIVWLLIAIFRHHEHGSETKPKLTALEILRRRYAKGKITKKEFEDMKKDLA
jgi:putative membrane protein